jgi:hypothetical protein
VNHPFGERKPSSQWYFETERAKRGGYYPIGSNESFHAGFHLFSKEHKQEVKAIAPGCVIAFRFYPERVTFIEGQNNRRPSNFVLIKHELKITENEQEKTKVFYSLYMDLECVSLEDFQKTGWFAKLEAQNRENLISLNYTNLGQEAAEAEGAHKRLRERSCP